MDDDIDEHEIFMMALRKVPIDIKCLLFSDPMEGLDRFKFDKSYVPRFIFIDINMPKYNGMECLKEIKKIKHLEETKILMFSTSSNPSDIQKSKDLGAYGFLIKPLRISDLTDSLVKLFNTREQETIIF